MGRESASRQWTEGETILGEYRVESKLGEGGMGSVYLVSHLDDRSILFAVKRTRTRDDTSRRAFLAELQTWIDLPDHPNLAACRFFRTEDDEVLIFADYLPGGSLSLWIAQGRLATLGSVLDVAIQFAWGLHQAHELGLVHQDVKPANVLMTEDGIAKVADFGLSRARARAESGRSVVGLGQGPPGVSILVSSGGLTPAYCSPEQAEGQRLSRRSDEWSWAVSVLEMFTGEVTWGHGTAAPDALEAYVADGGGRLPLPDSVASVLRQCLEQSPEARFESADGVADALRRAYEVEIGARYPRERPPVLTRDDWAEGRYERRTILGDTWRHPREWLELALSQAGRSPAEAGAMLPDYPGSKRAQEVADLSAYETALGLVTDLVRQGRDLEPQLAQLCTEKGNIHYSLQDIPGSLAMHGRATDLLERLVADGRHELVRPLALARTAQALAVGYQGPYDMMVQTAERAVSLLSGLAGRTAWPGLPSELCKAWHVLCTALNTVGRNIEALQVLAKAIPWAEAALRGQPSDETASGLAYLHEARAQALTVGNALSEAIDAAQAAEQLLRPLVYERGRSDLVYGLGALYLANGRRYALLGNYEEAVRRLDWAIQALDYVVHQRGQREVWYHLATAWGAKSHALRCLNTHEAAIDSARVSLAMTEDLVRRRGQTALVAQLADAYANLGLALFDGGERDEGVKVYSRSLVVLDRSAPGSTGSASGHLDLALILWLAERSLEARPHAGYAVDVLLRVVSEGGSAARPDLGRALGVRALIAVALGDERAAQIDARSAMTILEEQHAATGAESLQVFMDWLQTHCGHLL